jgi:signal peptidase II
MRSYRWILFFGIALSMVFLDQASKHWALSALAWGKTWSIIPVLDFRLVANTGAAFGLFAWGTGWQLPLLLALSFIMVTGLLLWLRQVGLHHLCLSYGILFIIAGALGNMIDRLLYGFVIDFIACHYGAWYFPVFNVADVSISLGCLGVFFAQRQPKPALA